MKKLLFFLVAVFWVFSSFAQNTLEVIDTGNITRERWRDSLLRMDMSQVPTGFLLEYSLFGFDSNKYDGVGNDDDTIKNDGQIFELHNTLWYSKVNSNAVIDVTDSLFSKAFFENRNDSVPYRSPERQRIHTTNQQLWDSFWKGRQFDEYQECRRRAAIFPYSSFQSPIADIWRFNWITTC